MKRLWSHIPLASVIVLLLVSHPTSRAQGYGAPLTFQGLDRFTAQSHLVDLSEVVHLPRQQFDEQVRRAKSQKISDEFGIELLW